jgi:lipoate-protein ligase A
MLIALPNAFGDAPTNMAIDAALLETLPGECALLRHYAWIEPSVTFGYSQHFNQISALAPDGVSLCRRMTGGGIVDHRNDWTYALVLGSDLACGQDSSSELYRTIHQSVATGINAQGIPTQLAACPRKCGESPAPFEGPDQCFLQPVMNDVLTSEGQKIAGAAMKRTRKGLLVQGSVARCALPDTFDFDAFMAAFTAGLSESLELPIHQPEDLRPLFDSELIAREKNKFGGDAWTKRR